MLAVFILHLKVLLMTYLNSGRFDKEEEAIAISNAADVGLAGRCLSPATIVISSSKCQVLPFKHYSQVCVCVLLFLRQGLAM